MRKRLLATIALTTGIAAPAAAQPLRFTLDVSPEAGGIDDTYTATVQIEVNGVAGPDRYWHPDFGDFEVEATQTKQGTSTVLDPARGQQIRTLIIRRYELRPTRGGRIRIRPAKIRMAGKEHETRSMVVQVGPASGLSAPPPGPSTGASDPTAAGSIGVPGFVQPDPSLSDEDMFLHVVADRKEVFVGEQVTVTWLIYTRSEILKFEPKPPSLNGLWPEILYEPDAYFTYHETTVGSSPYVVAIVSKRALFPTQAGRLEVKPFRAKVGSLSSSPGRSHNLASRSLTIRVKPLPPNPPPGFDPTYVGSFQVESSVDRNQIEASESLTLMVKVSGQGAIRRTEAPKLAFPGFSFRAPRDTQDTVDVSSGVVRGERMYRYWTTPEQGGQLTIPPIQVPYFDPRSGSYKVASSRPIPILVRGDPGKLARPAEGDGRENLIPRDIQLIHEGEAISSRAMPRLYRSSWFWVLAALPPLAFALVLVVDRVRQQLKKETPRSRLRRARGRARKRFRVAEIHLRGNRPAKFFGELARVLYDHIEERLGQPVQSMTRDALRDFLGDKGFDQATIQQIDQSLEAFDFARFAPTAAGPGEMRAHLRQLKELLLRIEKTRLVGGARSGEAA
ncbi:MAG TPA: BatD family protein [Kofleriaceae bacterium]|nr:BatD family protein [Kofleriaceae bacterium]